MRHCRNKVIFHFVRLGYFSGHVVDCITQFAYLIINKEDGVSYETDFRVYQRGTAYGSFPTMEKLGSTFAGLKTANGLTMLLMQAVRAEEIWQRRAMPEDARAELLRRLKEQNGET